MKKLRLVISTLYHNQQMRYLFVGLLNSALGYALYVGLTYIGVYYILSSTIGTVLVQVHGYFWHKYFVFQKAGHSIKEVVKFISVYLTQYLWGICFLFVCVDIMGINEYVAGLIGMFFGAIISYLGNKYVTFKK